MKDWNSTLERVGCKYTYDEIMKMLDKFISTLSPEERLLMKADIDTLFAKYLALFGYSNESTITNSNE